MNIILPYIDGIYSARYSLLYSAGFFFVGIILFTLLTYLASIPGNKKIDNVFMDEKEKQKQAVEKNKAKKVYIIALLAISAVIFIFSEMI